MNPTRPRPRPLFSFTAWRRRWRAALNLARAVHDLETDPSVSARFAAGQAEIVIDRHSVAMHPTDPAGRTAPPIADVRVDGTDPANRQRPVIESVAAAAQRVADDPQLLAAYNAGRVEMVVRIDGVFLSDARKLTVTSDTLGEMIADEALAWIEQARKDDA